MTANAETLKVVVQDQNGNTIPEAKVQIGNQEQITADSGAVTFSDVPGAQFLNVTAIGFSSKRMNLTAGQTEVLAVLAPIQTVDAVVVVGTRSIGRKALQAPVPIDVVNREQLSLTGQSETGRVLQMLVPSFNFPSSTISDGTDALRPATLRGLGPDQVLVLVNGKRRRDSTHTLKRGASVSYSHCEACGFLKEMTVLFSLHPRAFPCSILQAYR